MNNAILKYMKDRDRAKTKHKKNPNEENWANFKILRNKVNHAIESAKRDYFKKVAQTCDQKALWRELKSLNVCVNKKVQIPPNLTDVNINNSFVDSIPSASYHKKKMFSNIIITLKFPIHNLILGWL